MITVPVVTGCSSYDVVIGPGASRLLPDVLPEGVKKVAVFSQEEVPFSVDPGVASVALHVPSGESAKSLSTVGDLCRSMAREEISRRDAIVAVGGGVVTDVAGFCASVYLRGLSYVNVPTTLLAQVDAAIGGKTGVNIEEGKNLVGSFWQPAAVLCDTDSLGTLPDREWASGRGEMAKCVLLEESVDRLSGSGSAGPSRSWYGPLEDQIARCVMLKAAVVAADEREGGLRALLNYGHTLAHALEASALWSTRSDLRHGEAVAVGIAFAARLAQRLGRIDDARLAYHTKVLESFGLEGTMPAGCSATELLSYMARDKKARHDLTFVLDGPSGIEMVHGVDETEVREVLRDMGCDS